MSQGRQYQAESAIEQDLTPFYISIEQFNNHFQRINKLTNALNQEYIICKDTVKGKRALYKHYLYQSSQQREAVLTNLSNFIKLNQLEGICKFVAYTHEKQSNSLTAVFEYDDLSLDQIMKNRLYEGNNIEFYAKVLTELARVTDEAMEIGLQIDDLSRKNIVMQFQNGESESHQSIKKLKILYDQREKDYDLFLRYGNMIKLYWSPEKLHHQIINKEDYVDDEGQQTVYQIGLLLLDIVYQCQNSPPLNDSQASLTDSIDFSLSRDQPLTNVSELKRGYYSLNFSQNMIEADDAFIFYKLNYLLHSKNSLVKDMASLIRNMIAPLKQRMTMKELLGKCEKYGKNYHSPGSKMLMSHESLFSGKMSSQVIRDSLKYSANSMNLNEDFRSLVNSANEKNLQEMKTPVKKQILLPLSTTTLPSDGTNYLNHQTNIYIKQEKQQKQQKYLSNPIVTQKRMVRAGQLLKNCKNHHESVIRKLEQMIQKLHRMESKGHNVQKKQYHDGSFYVGQLNPVNNKRQGSGYYVYKSGEIYFGSWKENALLEGTYLFRNGQSFEGVAKNGKQGFGIYYYANGNIYNGHWKDDLKNGHGVMTYPSGSKYQGEWQKGKKNGRGIYYYENGMIFEGSFALGRKYGDGIFIFPTGTKITGFWDNNHLQGLGKIYYCNGDYYEGNFHLSEKSGQGSYKWQVEDGEISYKGEFKRDNLEGYAKIRFRNGEQYDGKVKNGKRDGHGTYIYANGDKFVGEWKNDEKLLGKYIFFSGQNFEGKFKEGQIKYGTMNYKNGEFYQGEFQKGERHGFGKYANSLGAMMYEGNWQRDEFVGEKII